MIPLDLLHLQSEETLLAERGLAAQELYDKYGDLGQSRGQEALQKAEAYVRSMESSVNARERSAQFEARNTTKTRCEDEAAVQRLELRLRMVEHCLADRREAALQKVLHG